MKRGREKTWDTLHKIKIAELELIGAQFIKLFCFYVSASREKFNYQFFPLLIDRRKIDRCSCTILR